MHSLAQIPLVGRTLPVYVCPAQPRPAGWGVIPWGCVVGNADGLVATPPAQRAVEPAVRRRRLGHVSAGHVVMVVAALLAVLLNYSVLRARDDSVRVAVAARDIPAGATLTSAALRFSPVAAEEDVLAALLTPEQVSELSGWVAATAITAGEPVRASDLRSPSAPASQRAMSLPVAREHAVGGALRPGDRVDVIEVRDGVAGYLVTDAEVLSVPTAEQRGIAALNEFSVTIAVDDGTALRLAAGLHTGTLDIVRSTGASPVAEDRNDARDDPVAAGAAREAE